MTPADVPAATAAVLRGDWGDRGPFFDFVAAHASCRPIVADEDGELVGTGVGTVNGSVGWVGTIYVVPERRGRGIGRALTEAVVSDLEAAGCRTLVLVATRAGMPVYERLGFRLQTHYVTLEAGGVPGPEHAIRSFAPDDLPAMAALDEAATGEDRRHLLAALAAPDTCRVVEEPAGRVAGFVLRAPWGGGATIARDQTTALRILAGRRAAADPARLVRAGLPAENEAGIARLLELGWVRGYEAPRMIRGEAAPWHPEMVWGQFNMALG